MKIFLLVTFTTSMSFGAIPSKTTVIEKLKVSPLSKRVENFKKNSQESVDALRRMAFDSQEVLAHRWNAFMVLTQILQKKSEPDILKALKDVDWFMRDAGLQAAASVLPEKAVLWSQAALSDKAMVVRTTAVKNLKSLKAIGSVDQLWSKLYSSENFRGTQSLWIRRHIMEALSDLSTSGDEARLIKVLDDNDHSLHPLAIETLERISGTRLGSRDLVLKARMALWKSWWISKSEPQKKNSKF